MGEPLCHPDLEKFLDISKDFGFKVIITTNGTLLAASKNILLSAPALHRINISLHAFEANDFSMPLEEYIHECFSFGQAAEGQTIVSYRLWNNGGLDSLNDRLISAAKSYFPDQWVETRMGTRIGQNIYLEHGDKFDWPDLSAEESSDKVFCYGMRDQIGILCDGSVVPCCLDHDGDIILGNIFNTDLESIIASPRARAIYDGFSQRTAVEELCKKCGYARRF